jgi:hypothetical protein
MSEAKTKLYQRVEAAERGEEVFLKQNSEADEFEEFTRP